MAKRFSDTDIWKKAWFRELDPRLKIAWFYILGSCDHAGFWDVDVDLLCFQTGIKLKLDELVEVLHGHVLKVSPTKIWIKDFIEFQYGTLKPNNNAHVSVVKLLRKTFGDNYSEQIETLTSAPAEGLGSPCPGAQDKDKDKDQDQDKEKGESEGGKPFRPKFDLEALYRKYPRKQGKEAGLRKAKAAIKTVDDFENLSTAIDRYIAHLRKSGTEPEFIQHFSTFMSHWTDWLDPDVGKAENFAVSGGNVINWDTFFDEAKQGETG